MNENDEELEALAKEIRQEGAAVIESSRTSIGHACHCGELLARAKNKVKHGEWGQWVKSNCSLSVRTAQLYMRLAANSEELLTRTQAIAHLTLEEADKLLSTPRLETAKLLAAHSPAEAVVPDDQKLLPDEMNAAPVPCPVLSIPKAATHTGMPSARVEQQAAPDVRDSLLDGLGMVASRLELCRVEVNRGDWDKANADAHLFLLADIAASIDAIRSTISVAVAEKVA